MKNVFFLSSLFLLLTIGACKQKTETTDTAATTESTGGPSGTFTIDAPRSMVKWTGSKPTGTHTGVIPISAGTIVMTDGLITGGTLELNVAGLAVTDLEGEYKTKLETHLKGEGSSEDDFFNTAKFPTGTFTVTSSRQLQNDPDGTHEITGDLKLKDVSKPITFKATVDVATGTAFKATTKPFLLDRTDWNIKYGSKKFFADLKDDFIHDEVSIELEIGAIKQ